MFVIIERNELINAFQGALRRVEYVEELLTGVYYAEEIGTPAPPLTRTYAKTAILPDVSPGTSSIDITLLSFFLR